MDDGISRFTTQVTNLERGASNAPERALPCPEEPAKPNATDFPQFVITGLAGEYANVHSAKMEAPNHFFFMAFLTCLGNIIANRVTLNSELQPQPRLYTLVLGESADDRKSTAINKTIGFFKDFLGQEFPVSWGVGSAEGLQKQMKETNPERLLLCLDEFKQFVAKCKIDSSVLLPCVNTLFESNRYESRTKKGDGIQLNNAFLSLLAASTVETYERTWDPAFTDIGFNNRLFLVPGQGQKRFSLPLKVSTQDKERLKKHLREVLDLANRTPELTLEAEALSLYDAWYMGLERSIHAKRLDTYALRLMILLAINDMKSCVTEDIVRQAIMLCDWQLNVRRIHDPIDADNAIARVEEKVRRILKEGAQREREIKRRLHVQRIGLWAYQAAMKNLREAEEITWDKGEKTWRPT